MSSFPVRFGRDFTVAAPTPNDLWIPQYGGEVLAAFDENLVAKNIVRMIGISQGTSMEFPMIHKMGAERHAAGARVTGQDVATGKRVISLDDRPILAAFEVDDIDTLKSHYEARSEMAKQAGVALAREMDKNSLQLGIKTARTAADAGGSVFNGGGYQADPDAALTGADWTASGTAFATDTAGTLPDTATGRYGRNHALTILKALEEIMISWDERDIPADERNCVVSPSAWHALRNIGLPADKATTATIVGFNPFKGGDQASPTDADASARSAVLAFNDFKIWRSPNLPKLNITTGEAKYQGNYTKVRALAIQKQAVGMLSLLGVKTETDRLVEFQTDLFVTKMLYGGGALRPECAVTIAIS
jgi:hypothetical protein